MRRTRTRSSSPPSPSSLQTPGGEGEGEGKRRRRRREKKKKKKMSKRKLRRIAEQARLEKMRLEKLEAGGTDDEFLAEIRADGVSKLIATGNASEINIMNPPRPGAKLLVLDLDETLYDFRSSDENVEARVLELKRPHVDAFLAKAYTYGYDLAIWSQSSFVRLEAVLTALGLLTADEYKFVFVLDASAMFDVSRTKPDGSIVVHPVKDLHFIWGKFPEHYTPCNTLMLDDLRRNMVLNPDNGLVIKPFNRRLRKAAVPDDTLVRLADYLYLIRESSDISLLNHAEWESVVVEARQPNSPSPSPSPSDDLFSSSMDIISLSS